MGALEYLKSRFGGCATSRAKSRKNYKREFKTVELKVLLDCDGCVRRVKNALASVKGVDSVDVDKDLQKVTVTGYVDAKEVLQEVRSKGKASAELWQYVPYNLVGNPVVANVYDKRNPPNHVIRTDAQYNAYLSSTNSQRIRDEKYTSLFDDDNTSSCSIM